MLPPMKIQHCRKIVPHDSQIRILTSAIFVASSFCVKPASALACEMAFPTVGATLEGGATSFSRSSLANLAWSVPTWPVLRPAVAICRTGPRRREMNVSAKSPGRHAITCSMSLSTHSFGHAR